MNALINWLDDRTGVRKLLHEGLYERVPGGARWRYVWGSTLAFTFFIQMITGIVLWMAYSPSSQTAWESVYYIQHEMTGGWLLRGIHHYTAQAMIVLLVLHLMQVVIDGAYKAPREFNFWTGMVLGLLILGLSLTGYLLPWDQKGFWATKVATNIMGIVPFVGPMMQRIVQGGADYGHHTLTRFFALHAGLLPALVLGMLGLHLYLFRRHGLTAKQPIRRADANFWPDQLLKDAVACLAVMAVVVFLVVRHGWGAHGGAPLSAPADPSQPYNAARPEWYFLFLFEFLKYFPGRSEIIGAIVIPSLVFLVMMLMPIVGKWKLGHRFNIAFLLILMAGIGLLTAGALRTDANNPDHHEAVAAAEKDAARVIALAQSPTGIPIEGAVSLLRNDPLTQGPRLFAAHCASCHRYGGHDGMKNTDLEPARAADLKGFATRQWLNDFFDPKKIASDQFFGNTKFHDGDMVTFVREDVFEEDRPLLPKVAAALSAEAKLPSQAEMDARDTKLIAEGIEAMDTLGCFDCHVFHDEGRPRAPLLTGYGSRDWLIGIIANPAHKKFYGDANDNMPAFADGVLDDRSIELIADWLRGEWGE